MAENSTKRHQKPSSLKLYFQRVKSQYGFWILRQQLTTGKPKSLKFADSRSDDLIQLADMAAGAIARSYRDDDRKNASRWRIMMKSKIEDVWEFGRRKW
ncbi:MAG: DUF3800 domain-containing protein [Desulfuromonadaceae bacterium]|nr:DUF3800 domain-containing protein [Desulfuromonadaceae bacterium]MDD2856997.1 DUF3800 domain-containing protein [Desulfuromonadaceae bacterium]